MKGKNLLKLLLALTMTAVPTVGLVGCGESASPSGGGSGGSGQHQEMGATFDVENGIVQYIKNQSVGNYNCDDVKLPTDSNVYAISSNLQSYSNIRKLTIPKNIQKIVDNNGIPCTNEFLIEQFGLLESSDLIQEIVVEEGNIAFSMQNGFLIYNGITIYATPKILENENLDLKLENISNRVFTRFNDNQSSKTNLKNISIDFKGKEAGEVGNILDDLCRCISNIENLTLKNLSADSSLDLRDVHIKNLIISNGNASIFAENIDSISLQEGVESFKFSGGDNDVKITIPKTLKNLSVYAGGQITYNLPYSQIEFEEEGLYNKFGLYDYPDYSYKKQGLQDELYLSDCNIKINFKAHTVEDQKKVEFYQAFNYEMVNDYVVVYGYFKYGYGEIFIPETVDGYPVKQIIFSSNSSEKGEPQFGSYSKLSLPKTIEMVTYEDENANYTFNSVEFRGTKAEFNALKQQLTVIKDYLCVGSVICSDGEVELAQAMQVSSTYTYKYNGKTYLINADWVNEAIEVIVSDSTGELYHRHFINDEYNHYDFESDYMYLDIENTQLELNKTSVYDTVEGVNSYDVTLSVNGSSRINSLSKVRFDGGIAHHFEEKIIENATCHNVGYKADVCPYCDLEEKGTRQEIPQTNHSVVLSINSNNFGRCNSCGDYLLGSYSYSNGYVFEEYDGYQEYRNQVTDLIIPSNAVVKFNSSVSTLFPNLRSVQVNNISDWFKCQFVSAESNPLSIGIALNVKNATSGNFEPIKNLIIDSSISKLNNYAFYGCTGLESIDFGTGNLTVGESAFANITSLKTLNIPSFNTNLSSTTFDSCANVTTIKNITSNQYGAINNLRETSNFICENLYFNGGNSDAFGSVSKVYIEIESDYDCYINNAFQTSDLYIDNLELWFNKVRFSSNEDNSLSKNGTFNLWVKNNDTYEKVTGELVVPESVSYISDSSLKINGLTKVVCNKNLSDFSENALADSLEELSIPVGLVKNITTFVRKLNVLYDGSNTTLIGKTINSVNYNALEGSFEEVVLEKGITTIGENAFNNSKTIKKINLDNVEIIGSYAFAGSSIEELGKTLNLTTLANGSFNNCGSLKYFCLGAVKSIGSYSFKGCTELQIESGYDGCIKTIGAEAFAGLKPIEFIDLSAITSCSPNAFNNTIVKGITIGDYDSSLNVNPTEKLVIKNASTSLSFSSLNDNIEIHLPKGVADIYGKSNANWKVYFDGTISDWASVNFHTGGISQLYIGNTLAENITIENVDNIGLAFANISSIKSVVIRNAKTIAEGAFANCENLLSVTIENSNTNKPNLNSTFENCVALRTVELKGDLGTLNNTFLECSNLESVVCDGEVTLHNIVFKNCNKLNTLSIPKAVRTKSSSGSSTQLFSGMNNINTLVATADFVNNLDSELVYGNSLNISELDVRFATATALNNLSYTNPSSVTIAEGITQIQGLGNKVLTSLTLPSTIQAISTSYKSCSSNIGKNTIVNLGFDFNEYINNNFSFSLFEKTQNVNLKDNASFPSIVELTDAISIGKNIFKGMKCLTKLSLPDGCTFSGDFIKGCDNLTELSVPYGEQSITDMFGGTISSKLSKISIGAWKTNSDNRKVIPDNMFKDCKATTLSYPNDFEVIGESSFENTDINTFVVPDTVFSIEKNAFKNAKNLVSISISKNCEYILDGVFSGCEKLESLTLNKAYNTIPNLFVFDFNTYEYSIPESLKTVTIGSWSETTGSRKHIPNNMFKGLKGVTLSYPADYEIIGDYAFAGTDIESLEISSSCNEIGAHAFENSSVTKAVIPNRVTIIEEYTFANCANLKEVCFSSYSQSKMFKKFAFKNCGNIELTKIEVSDDSVGYDNFISCWLNSSFYYDATNVDASANPVYYSNNLYYGNRVVENVKAEAPKNISPFAFINLKSLKTVNLTGTANTLGVSAFEGCDALTSIKFSINESIPDRLFYNYTNLKEVNISCVGSIGNYAFAVSDEKSSALENVTLGCTTTIATNALKNCKNILEVNIGTKNNSDFNGLLDDATKLYKAEIASKTGYAFGKSSYSYGDNQFKNLQYLTYRLDFDSKNNENAKVTFGSNKIYTKSLKQLTFKGTGTLSITSSLTPYGSSLYSLNFIGKNNSSDLVIGSISADAFQGTHGKIKLKELYNTTQTNMQKDVSGAVNSFYESVVNYTTDSSNIVIAENYDGVYFKRIDSTTNETYFELIDFREDNRASYEFVDSIDKVIDINGEEQTLGNIKYSTLFGGHLNETIEELMVSKGFAENEIGGFGAINKVTYKEGVEKILGIKPLGLTPSLTEIVIPSTLKAICGFAGSTNLTTISLLGKAPALTTISNDAFKNCSKLTDISALMGEGLTKICDGAFSGTGITSVTLPSTLQIIGFAGDTSLFGTGVFSNCNNLVSVTIPSDSELTLVGKKSFMNTGITSISLPENIQTIGASAFENCSSLVNVTGLNGENLTSIEQSAFASSGIREAILGNGLTTLYWRTFYNCPNLETITLGANLEIITGATENYLFYGCNKLTTINSPYNDTIKYFAKGNNLFVRTASSQTLIYVANGSTGLFDADGKAYADIDYIDEYAFTNYAGNTTEWELPISVKTIGASAFRNSKVTKLIFGGVRKIENYAFDSSSIHTIVSSKNSTETGINFNENLTILGDGAFMNCNSLTTVTLPSSITSISKNLFANSSLTSINMPNVITIGDNAFSHSKLQSVHLSNLLENIGASVFEGSELRSVTFDSDFKLNSIAQNMFKNTQYLASIKLPSSIIKIEEGAFENSILGSIDLTNITIKNLELGKSSLKGTRITNFDFAKVGEIGDSAFENSSLTTLESYKNNTTSSSIGARAFANTPIASEIYIPGSVTLIGENAFAVSDVSQIAKLTTPYIGKNAITNSSTTDYAGGLSYFFGEEITSLNTLEIIEYNNSYSNIILDLKSLENTTIINLKLFKRILKIVDTGEELYINKNKNIQNFYFNGTLEKWCEIDQTVDASLSQITENIYCNETLIEGDITVGDATSENGLSIKPGKFKDYNKITSITLAGKSVGVGTSAFENVNLVSINRDACETLMIGPSAFKNTKLTNISLTENDRLTGLEGIDGEHFANIQTLQSASLSIRNLVSKNATYAFKNCTNLKDVTIADSVNSAIVVITHIIPDGTFYNCSSITNITIPSNTTYIGVSAFENCSALKAVGISFSKVTYASDSSDNGKYLLIENNAFKNCTTLETLTFKNVYGYDITHNDTEHNLMGDFIVGRYNANGESTIDEYDVKIEKYHSLIGFKDFAFLNCTNLKKVYYVGTDSTITDYYEGNYKKLWADNIFQVNSKLENFGTYEWYNTIFSSNPLYYGGTLYVGTSVETATPVTEVSSATGDIKRTAWTGSSITKATIGTTQNDFYSFVNCKSLKEIIACNTSVFTFASKFIGCTSIDTITLDNAASNYGFSTGNWKAENGLVYNNEVNGVPKLWLVYGNSYNDSNLNLKDASGYDTGIKTINPFAFSASTVSDVTLTDCNLIKQNGLALSNITNLTIQSKVWNLIEKGKYGVSVEGNNVNNYLEILKDPSKGTTMSC